MSSLTLRDDGTCVHVEHDGGQLAGYVYRPDVAQLESPRPYLHPVRTLGGELVSLYRPHDHVWHKGIVWSLPHVGPHNFWGGPTFVRDRGYVQLHNDGSMDHEGFSALDQGVDGVELVQDLAWRTQPDGAAPGEHVVTERRTMRATVLGAGTRSWALFFTSTMTNVSQLELPLGSPTTHGRENAGYGGLFWRGPRSFTDGALLAPGRSGGDELRGLRAPWMGFSGRHDGSGGASGVVVVDLPGNPGGEPRWFARTEDFACICPAPFFDQDVPFGPGDELTFRYAVVVADGAVDPDRAAGLADAAARLAGAPARRGASAVAS